MCSESAEKKWNEIYATKNLATKKLQAKTAEVLTEHVHLLPKSGAALDLACGLGSNAIFLANHGLDTQAWDISEVVIQKLQTHSQENNLGITCETRDVEKHPPAPSSFDVICISYYLERELSASIIRALKPNGLLFYQTFTKEKVSDFGPSNPNYRLQENELLKLFSPLHVLAYQEYGIVGDINQGLRDVATLVAQKR
jgi:2-polyprenyl-3-methyl-5-hydroxy-6-metoxy-1,4-benzoquinol methylase